MTRRPIRAVVTDPAGEIENVNLVYQSPDCVVLHVDLRKKRQDVTGTTDTEVFFGLASVRLVNLPFRQACVFGRTVRYTCFVAFLRRGRLLECGDEPDTWLYGRGEQFAKEHQP